MPNGLGGAGFARVAKAASGRYPASRQGIEDSFTHHPIAQRKQCTPWSHHVATPPFRSDQFAQAAWQSEAGQSVWTGVADRLDAVSTSGSDSFDEPEIQVHFLA